jgi:hypothetical protein
MLGLASKENTFFNLSSWHVAVKDRQFIVKIREALKVC